MCQDHTPFWVIIADGFTQLGGPGPTCSADADASLGGTDFVVCGRASAK